MAAKKMTAKLNKEKMDRRRERAAYKEHLTNWYMLNFIYGVLGIIVFLILGTCYRKSSMLVHMQTFSWVMTAIFAIGAATLFALGKMGKIKNTKRAVNYSILLGVCALFSLWLALYNKIRVIMEAAARVLLRNPNLSVNSYWNTRIPIILIVAYLVVSFIVYTVKVTRK